MKEGWKMVKLGEVCEIINGKNQKEVISPEGQFPILGSGGNVMGYATEYLCPAGTIIIGRKGSINNPLFIDTPFWNVDTAFGFNARDNYERKLLYYFCLLFDFEKLNKGTTLPSLVKSDLLQIEIPLPPLEEQHRIVSILDASFEKIDALKKNAEENLKNAKALFQQVLAQELKPKEGWVETKMETICTLCQGLAINAQTKHLIVEKSNLPLLRIKDLKDGTREIFINEDNCPESCKVYSNDIIYTRTGTLGLIFTGVNGVMHNNCFKIILDQKKVEKHYVMYYLHTTSFKERVIAMAQRAAQPDITHKIFKAQYICFPSIETQHRIVQTLDTLSEKCRRLEQVAQQTIRECDALKQSILRQAFSGEL